MLRRRIPMLATAVAFLLQGCGSSEAVTDDGLKDAMGDMGGNDGHGAKDGAGAMGGSGGSGAGNAFDGSSADASPRTDGSPGAGGGPTDGGGFFDGPVISCGVYGATCTVGSECCSGACDPKTQTCVAISSSCSVPGAPCAALTDCCTLTCVNDACGATSCTSDHQACSTDGACCSGQCANGTCAPLNTSCKTQGNACAANGDCCSQFCSNGKCGSPSFCVQTGDICARPTDCCGGICNVAQGATVGTCANPPSGATYCSDAVDGTVCTGCGSCCSRLCAPYGPTGVSICQPANGCHVDGDLCRQDTDCCGAAGTGLPGDGNVHCEIATGQKIGICRNPMGCNPEGNVCHYKDYACSISSARNDCCAAPGNSGECQLDALGVPRCHGFGTSCRNGGDTCAFTGDCCNGAPCVPDSVGQLRCLTSTPDGGVACSSQGGSCTINADCCRSLTCLTATGSVQGTCGLVTPPPDGGSAPPDASSDAGSPSDAQADVTNVDSTPPTTCGLYGQSCQTSGDCCSSVPCTNPLQKPCAAGDTACACTFPIQ
jgi:hypothetical protein